MSIEFNNIQTSGTIISRVNQKMNRGEDHVRIKENFLNFCSIVLEYTEFVPGPCRVTTEISKIDKNSSNGSEIETSDSEIMSDNSDSTIDSSEESYNVVSCFCRKPFSGRPMIECSKCLMWIHLSCAKVRRTKIPEEFICQACREQNLQKRVSNRIRFEKRPHDISD